uniref:co-chaperone DjlA n=1 Tax=Thaumasiovibrio occultus TaxID=1891184 RepID=UPI000B34BA70|nr:co-chaperone DjlA [Thaumasiovibrio occultus]
MIGKLIGAILGMLLLNFPGLILGLFLGHQVDKFRRLTGYGGFGSQAERQAIQAALFRHAFAVMGHVAKAKGVVTQEEIRVASSLMDRMQLHGEARQQAQEAFREGKGSEFPLDDVLAEVRQLARGRTDLLQFFIELQITAAFADGSVHPAERDLLYRIAASLGMSTQSMAQRIRMQEAAFRFSQGGFQGQAHGGFGSQQQAPRRDQLADAYELLGSSEQATEQELKRAYRKQMNEHHPDKLAAKGLPPEMMELAKEKAQEIQVAYDLIKRSRGMA